MLTIYTLAAAAVLALIPALAVAAPRTATVTTGHLGEVEILAPAAEPAAFAILVSDGAGITAAVRADAELLVAEGAAVALIDLPALVAAKEKQDNAGCHYVFGDFEETARLGARALEMRTWRWPVVVGIGPGGGTMAYLAMAQAPSNTAAGAVSLGFQPVLAGAQPLCPGAPATARPGGGYDIAPMANLPAPWTLILPGDPPAALRPFLAGPATAVRAEGDAAFAAAAQAVLALGAGPADPLADLPIVELPAADPIALAIFISGDGGWRDLDKTIGEWLAAHGVAVIGVDALRYFWRERQPDEVASAVDRIAAHYAAAWGTDRLVLLGYSFGADVMPLLWPKLNQATHAQTALIGLLGLARAARLEVSITGWLGLSSSKDIPLAEPLAALPADRVMCFYGTSEAANDETGCTLPALAEATLIERPGGHHFDGNYAAMAQVIHDRIAAAVAADR